MKEADFDTRDLFLLVTYVIRKQGTDTKRKLDEERNRWVSYADLQEVFGIPRDTARDMLNKLMDRVSAGRGEYDNEVILHAGSKKFYLALPVDLPSLKEYQRFTVKEAIALKLALKTWREMVGKGVRAEIDDLIQAVNGLVGSALTGDVRYLEGRTAVALPEESTALARKLREAISGKRQIRFDYRDRATGIVTKREVDPYTIFFTDDRWYLAGWCHLRDDTRTFYVDDISGLKVSRKGFRPRHLGLSSRELAEGPFEDKELPVNVRLRFLPPVARWAEERSGGKGLKRLKDGSVITTTWVRSIEGMKSTLLTFGDRVEVLEPEELREGLLENARALAKMYAK